MRRLLTITAKDLRLRLRDRSIFIIALLAPLALAFIFNLVFGGVLSGDIAFEPDFGIVTTGSTETAATLRSTAEELGATWHEFADRTAAEEAIRGNRVDAVFLVPDDFDRALAGGEAVTIEVLGDVASPTASEVAAAIARRYGAGVDRIRLAVAGAITLGADPAPVMQPPEGSLVSVGSLPIRVRQLDGATFTVAGMAVFFLLFTAQTGLLSVLEERRDGTLARMLATPATTTTILGAKALVSVTLGLGSILVLIIAGRFLLGARWGDPLGVALLSVGAVLAAVGISAVTVALARTPEGAGNLGGIVGTVLGLLGGSFFPISADQALLSRLSAITPHHWFLRGLADLSGGGGPSEAVGAFVPLIVITVISGLLAALIMRRQVAR